jgi:4-oxalocrotonate tautomerase
MPFLRLTLQPQPDDAVKMRLAQGLTQLMATFLHKKAELTSVLVETPAALLWTIGGAATATTAKLEVAITVGTNQTAEKAAFIEAAHALLRAEVPSLAPVAYVVLLEIPAENWGYDGQSQAARRGLASP